MVAFVSSPVSHCNLLIELGSALNIRHSQPRTSFLVLLLMKGFLCISLNIVVFVALDGCNNNRRHSDISLFDKFYISPRLVRYSSIPSLIFSTPTILKVVLANQSHPTYKRP